VFAAPPQACDEAKGDTEALAHSLTPIDVGQPQCGCKGRWPARQPFTTAIGAAAARKDGTLLSTHSIMMKRETLASPKSTFR
jgi:hypothetical protein